MKVALYDLRLRECPTTYDYFVWLTQIRILGYTHVNFNTSWFRTKKHPGGASEAKQRFNNFIWPAPIFAGLGRSVSSDGDRIGSCLIPDLVAMGCGTNIPRLKSNKPPATNKYTVTLRYMAYKRERNSNMKLWKDFARLTEAHVINDYFVKPITLEDRMSLVAGAKMNFGVANGPMALLLWTEYPLRMFCDPELEVLMRSMRNHGCNVGQQWPFQLPNQKIVWKKPTLENLMAEFEECERQSMT